MSASGTVPEIGSLGYLLNKFYSEQAFIFASLYFAS